VQENHRASPILRRTLAYQSMSLVAICERLLRQHQNSQYRQTLNAAILLIDHYARNKRMKIYIEVLGWCRCADLLEMKVQVVSFFPFFFFFSFLWGGL